MNDSTLPDSTEPAINPITHEAKNDLVKLRNLYKTRLLSAVFYSPILVTFFTAKILSSLFTHSYSGQLTWIDALTITSIIIVFIAALYANHKLSPWVELIPTIQLYRIFIYVFTIASVIFILARVTELAFVVITFAAVLGIFCIIWIIVNLVIINALRRYNHEGQRRHPRS